MMRRRITSLTPQQEALLPLVRDEWLGHGLSTEPADRFAAERGVCAAYEAAGLAPPRFVIWLGSPWAGVLGQAVAPAVISAYCHDQVYAQVRDQVDAQVYAQVDTQVYAQVRDQVDAQVDTQVDTQVGAQVYAQVDAQVYAQVRDQVYAQVGDQVRAQVRDQVRDQVDAQVRDQVGDQVDTQVYAQVRDQVDAQVDTQVHNQVYAQVRAQADAQVGGWYSAYLGGCHWASYYGWLDAMARLGVTGLGPIHGRAQVARSACWWFPYRHSVVLTERPSVLRRDTQNRLHSADGPAICYPDGWGFCCWHGRRVPAWVVEAPTAEKIAAERNVEVRRCAIEALGWEKFTQQAELRLISRRPDPGNTPHYIELYDVPERLWGGRVRMILVTNGTPEADGTHRKFGVTVDAAVNDAVAAGAWSYDDPDHPVRVTPEVYAQTARRT